MQFGAVEVRGFFRSLRRHWLGVAVVGLASLGISLAADQVTTEITSVYATAAGLLTGALLGFAYVLVRYLRDRRLLAPGLIESRFDVRVLGAIPEVDSLRTSLALGAFPEQRSPFRDDPSRDSLQRQLRLALALVAGERPMRSVVVASPCPGDGSSTVALQLASAIASSGQMVVLINADVWGMNGIIPPEAEVSVGLSDVLLGRVHPRETLRRVDDEACLFTMPPGRTTADPSTLLGSPVTEILLKRLAELDVVAVLDAPPLHHRKDAAVLAGKCDGTLLVTSHGETAESDLAAALERLDGKGRILGVIVNRVPREMADDFWGRKRLSHQA